MWKLWLWLQSVCYWFSFPPLLKSHSFFLESFFCLFVCFFFFSLNIFFRIKVSGWEIYHCFYVLRWFYFILPHGWYYSWIYNRKLAVILSLTWIAVVHCLKVSIIAAKKSAHWHFFSGNLWRFLRFFLFLFVLYSEYLCSPQIHMLKPNFQCERIRKWGLWEVIIIILLQKRRQRAPLCLLPCEDTTLRLKQQKCILSKFWRLEVWNIVLVKEDSRKESLSKGSRKESSAALPSFWL